MIIRKHQLGVYKRLMIVFILRLVSI